MLKVSAALQAQFQGWLRINWVPNHVQSFYLKWLRYSLDFSRKYRLPATQEESLDRFLDKLREKKQTTAQQEHACHAVKLYQDLVATTAQENEVRSPQEVAFPTKASLSPAREVVSAPKAPAHSHFSPSSSRNSSNTSGSISPARENPGQPSLFPVSPSRAESPSTGVSWKAEYTRLAHEIQVRHYSPKTLKTYTQWLRHYQTFTRSLDPKLLSAAQVKGFLTHLAVTRKVSAATQNQAFNALLFFYRNVLNQEFGKIEGVVRAKRKPYIPVVLSKEEIEAILKQLAALYDLVVKLLYGCGLRLFECLQLRAQCLNYPHKQVRQVA